MTIVLRRWPASSALALLAALGAWEVVTLSRAARSEPDPEDWRRAAAIVREGFRDGDLVVFAPTWIEPVGRLHLGDLVALPDLGRMDAVRYPRIWEVSSRGEDGADVRSAVAGAPPAWERRVGRLRVRRFEHDVPRVVWDLRDGGGLCDVAGRPRWGRTLELGSRPARIEAGRVELAARLVVAAGLASPSPAGAPAGPPVAARLTVLIDGREEAAALIDEHTGWTRLPEVSTAPGRHDVVIAAIAMGSTQGTAAASLCVAAESRSPSGSADGVARTASLAPRASSRSSFPRELPGDLR